MRPGSSSHRQSKGAIDQSTKSYKQCADSLKTSARMFSVQDGYCDPADAERNPSFRLVGVIEDGDLVVGCPPDWGLCSE